MCHPTFVEPQFSVRGEFPDVVYHAEQLPLRVDLHFAAKAKPIKPKVMSNVAEHRFNRAHSTAVVLSATLGVETPDHPIRRRGCRLQDFHAAHLTLLPTNALGSQRADSAVLTRSVVLPTGVAFRPINECIS